MTLMEANQVIQNMSKLKPDIMELEDQLTYFHVIEEFAEKLKPITLKYFNQMPEGTTFLIKM